jgi:hypothetical protein
MDGDYLSPLAYVKGKSKGLSNPAQTAIFELRMVK